MSAGDDKFNLFVGPGSDQFPLRLPDGYRDQIKAAAKSNGRSMNAEVLYRLMSYDARQPAAPAVVAVDASQVEEAIGAVRRLREAVAEASAACSALGINIEVRK